MVESTRTHIVLLFSDIESSTQLWERFPEEMADALARHDVILKQNIHTSEGRVVKTTGDGVMAVFEAVNPAVEAGAGIQQSLAAEDWGRLGQLKVRIALHSGEAQHREDDFFGPTVNRAARLMAAGHGGQTLLSEAVQIQLGAVVPSGMTIRDLGQHRLKDLSEPEHIYQLSMPGNESFPALTTLDVTPNNLPTLRSSFLGRQREQGEIRHLLESGDSRLVTLLGPGGTGKTRLGLQAVADQVDRFPDGVFFVDLSSETGADDSFANVARATGIDSTADESALDALIRGLADRSTLLLLDNLEQIHAIGLGINRLLQSCPSVSVLATSREPLRVSGEQLYPVEPLSIPKGRGTQATSETVRGSEAGRLFEERAQQTSHDFVVDDTNAAVVTEVVTQLDGLPLGIELAAARLRMFSVHELQERLSTKLDILSSSAHDLPQRQKTLNNTIEWSYELLNQSEQVLLETLSVFATGSFDDIESVAAQLSPGEDMFASLDSLVDKSLVRRTDTSPGTSRFGLLETIRSFATQRATAKPDQWEGVRGAHATHFAELAGSLLSQLNGAARQEARGRLISDLENLQIAWTYWLSHSDIDRLHQLFDPMWILYDSEGWYQGTVTLAEDLLEVLENEPRSDENTSEQVALRTSLARARMLIRGYTEETEEAFLEALAQAESSGKVPQRFPVLRSLASLYIQRREGEKAVEIGEQLLEIAAGQDDPALSVEANLVYGVNIGIQEDLDLGVSYLRKAVEAFDPSEMHGERFRLGPNAGVIALTSSAFMLTWQGYPDQARQRAAQALRDAERLGHSYSIAYAHFHVAYFSLMYRDLETVGEQARHLLALANQYDYQIWRALAIVLSGVVEAFTGDPDQAMPAVEKGIELYRQLPSPPIFWAMLLQLRAPVAAMAGQVDRGVELIDQAIELEPDPATALLAEFLITKGDVLLMGGRPLEATEQFSRALENATAHGTRLTELRALTRIVRGGGETHRRELTAIYDSFTEGFDMPDLVEARQILGR